MKGVPFKIVISTVACFAALAAAGQARAGNPASCPVLNGSYTLTFNAQFNRIPHALAYASSDLKQPGTVTISSDGKRMLTRMDFGNWNKTVIYDSDKSVEYTHESTSLTAAITRGLGKAFVDMLYPPFPAAGFNEIPFLKTINCKNGGTDCSGSIAYVGYQDHNIPKYRDDGTKITMSRWNNFPVVAAATAIAPKSHDLPESHVLQEWKFTNYRDFQSVPIAQTITYDDNLVQQVAGTSWKFTPDCSITYTLKQAAPTPAPDRQFQIENYLTAKNFIFDSSGTRATRYAFDPSRSLDDLRSASIKSGGLVAPDEIPPLVDPKRIAAVVVVLVVCVGFFALIRNRRTA